MDLLIRRTIAIVFGKKLVFVIIPLHSQLGESSQKGSARTKEIAPMSTQ